MIEQNTVLILGAGASIPYGFPSGTKLSEDMIRAMIGCQDGYDELSRFTGVRPGTIRDIGSNILKTDLFSVDRYLLILGKEDESLTDTVKAVMAYQLYQYEERNPTVERRSIGKNGDVNIFDHWYRILWDRLQAPTIDAFKQNRLTILTFNYDRSLTEYLFQRILATYHQSEHDAAKMLRTTVRIIHLHGSMGTHPALAEDPHDPDIVPYGIKCVAEFISIARKQIKIVHEDSSSHDVRTEIKTAIRVANSVVFLGLSYQEENLQKLFLCGPEEDKPLWAHTPIVCGTTYRMSDGDIAATAQYFAPIVPQPGFRSRQEDFCVGDFLQQTGILRGQCQQGPAMSYLNKKIQFK